MCNLMATLRNILTLLTIGATFQLFGQSVGKDTTFIFREITDEYLHIIFIDNNIDSKFYDKVSRFYFQQFDNEGYNYSLDYIKGNNLNLTKVTPVIPWTNWVILKQYKGQFYVYKPSDFLFHFRQSVNDTTFIDWTGEGPEANKIIEQNKIDNKTYEFNLTGITHKARILTIHILDLERGIAVFEQTTNGTDKRFYLMIAAEKVKSVPIIINYCTTQKQMELEFDKPDFYTLLRTK